MFRFKDVQSSSITPEKTMSEEEIRAYSAGYNSATKLFKDIIDEWEKMVEFHGYCGCALCRTLREVAHGRFEFMETSPDRKKYYPH